MNEKIQYLKILSVAYYVVGALAGLFACFPIIHLVAGLGMLLAGTTGEFGEEGLPFLLGGGMFTLIAGTIIVLGWAYAIGLIVTGYFLGRHTHHLFCLVMGGIACLFMPFGTVLGVLTLVLLLSPDVKALFEAEEVV
ncbi:MAG TPA: hypothetical protein PKH77_06945 [Anaerolineae bacterium]|nr:hypothetical protein [Anaerolineae bacterium]